MTAILPAYPAAPRRPLHAGPVKRCPSCAALLDGGPVHFRCDPCGRSVMAADLNTEFHPTDRHGTDALDSNPARTVPDGRHAG